MVDAVVVGSGPNGLAAAITLAQHGVDVTVVEAADEIGGGTRSAELTVPGVIHDICSAVHPMALASPFFRSLDLAAHGLQWDWPDVDLAHVLDGGRAGVLVRDLDQTVAGLGSDGDAWARLMRPLADRLPDLVEDVFGPIMAIPHHPVLLASFGLRGLLPARTVARRWSTDEARALFAGLAEHAVYPLDRPTTGSIGLVFAAAAHRYGWPVARGGSASIAAALASVLSSLGGRIETGQRVTSLPDADLILFDTVPREVLAIAGPRLPARVQRALARWKHGAAAFKLDLAVDGGIPWTHPDARRAGTVHVGGTFEEVLDASRRVHAGVMPQRPFVLVGQQYLADPSRSVGNIHPVWAYAHVPRGYTADASNLIVDQLERFAPGTRDRIVASAVATPADLEAHNRNYVGGDITGGMNSPLQLLARPRISPDPYSLRSDGLYLCSSSTPPGGGVHGMAGHNAARSALWDLGLLR